MNKFQRLVVQITKDDFKKPGFRAEQSELNFRHHRNGWRKVLKDSSLERIRDFRNFNKGLEV